MNERLWRLPRWKQHFFSLFISLFIMGIATGLSFLYHSSVPSNTANIALVYILALVLVARYTVGYAYGIIFSLTLILN